MTVTRDTSQLVAGCYLQLINSNPALLGKPLEHWNQKLETARPMANKQHHAYQVEDTHEDAGHVEELKSNILLVRRPVLTFSSFMETQQSFGKPCSIGTRN